MRLLAIGLFLLALLGLSLISGFRPLYFILYTTVVAFALAYLWAWLQSRGLEVTMDCLDPHPQVGQPFRLRIKVRERIGFPRVTLRASVSEQPMPATESTLDLWPRRATTWTELLVDHHRGLNDIGSLNTGSSDPFGLVRLGRRIGEPRNILVYPSTVPLSTSPGGYAALDQSMELSRRANDGTAIAKVREYMPGDSLRHIHWPTTARLNHLMTKEFEGGGRSEEIWIMLDLHADSQVGSGPLGTEEYGITIAASLARALLELGEPVGLIAHGNTPYRLPPQRGAAHQRAILEALALVAAEGTAPLHQLLAQQSQLVGPGSTVVVIAPWRHEVLADAFDQYSQRDISVLPIYLDAASFDRHPGLPPPSDGQDDPTDGTCVIQLGDDLAYALSGVMDRLFY